MKPMYISINSEKTGANLKSLFKNNGYSVRDIQSVMGFENPQSIYKWLSGRSLPSLDNLVILSKVLHTTIEDILVVDGDVVFLFHLTWKETYRINHYILEMIDDLNDSKLERASNLAESESLLNK